MATQTMAKDDQEFTFPTTLETPPPPRFLELPPIWWRTTSAVASHYENPKRGEGERRGEDDDKESVCHVPSLLSNKEANNHTQRRSFSCIEGRTKRRDHDEHHHGENEEEEEKMDMLWEDFNEEYKRSRDLSSTIGKMELQCVQSLKLSKPSKRPIQSMVVVMKVLKKVFLLHDSHNSSFKKQHQHP